MTEPVFCEACGTVHEQATEQIARLKEAVTNLGLEVSRKQARINALRRDQANARPPEYDEAMEVAEFWRSEVSPRAKELNGPRLEKVIARLRAGYSVEELKHAVWGYRCRPNVKDGKRVPSRQGGKRYADLELIMRDELHVQTGIMIADEENGFDQGLLEVGASKRVAQLCDCGHPMWAHGLLWLQGHEGCYEQGCSCRAWDVYEQRLTEPPGSPQIPRRERQVPDDGLNVEKQESLL